ncbi:MAG TPA: hypothetical protein PLT82_11220 [Candidatus Hydrogenedens sp.]|nr:hypothetical protein [Candidatus Hydrogenedens sp.]HOK09980.1 hypothetical protein [Candidatus Hydrogenedens sp.]HOL19685.1 hypothetical protein [Candidatus Hydrogenedens sp.]HPP59693.1 hypothetical protein [Candidatus Hydrogenedens sp.]
MSILDTLCFAERWGEVISPARTQLSAETETDENKEVNRYTLRELKPEEYVVFTLDLCHNQIDRHFSCFPEEELNTINRLVPGRPLMERHDLRGSLPRGTFFRSTLSRNGDYVSVRPKVYVLLLDENRHFIANIEGGIYRETSIGFSFTFPECSICGKDIRQCIHVPGTKYDGNLCFYHIRGVQDVLEGSVVACGSQGTSFITEARSQFAERMAEKSQNILGLNYFNEYKNRNHKYWSYE